MSDVSAIGRVAHPVGSADHDRVRDYLLVRLKALGLQVRSQQAVAASRRNYGGQTYVFGGEVTDLIGVLPGRNPKLPAIAVQAHYDSVQNSPGAADDGAGVASALEVARAVQSGPQPQRDIVFLITDGEELGLVGAHAFWEQDPLARHVGFVVNLDTRGGGGRAAMFETGAEDGPTVRMFERSAVRPTSNSLALFMYKHMPNDTDFTVSKAHGVPGLNFAFIGRQFDYHAFTSTPARLDPGSLQHMGELTLSAVRAAEARAQLPGPGPDLTYSDVFGALLVAYPPGLGWLLLAVAAALLGWAGWRAFKRGETGARETARGALGALALMIALCGGLLAARGLTGVPFGFVAERPLLARFPLYETELFVLSLAVTMGWVAALRGERPLIAAAVLLVTGALAWLAGGSAVIGAACALASLVSLGVLRRAIRPWSGFLGFAAMALVMALLLQALAPSIAYVLEWPLLVAAVAGLAAERLGGFDRGAAPLVLGLIGAVAIGWLLPLGHFVALGVGADYPSGLAPVAWLVALVGAPVLLMTPRPAAVAALLLATCLAGLGVIRFIDSASPEHPRATEIVYLSTPKGPLRLALTPDLDPWTRSALTADGGAIRREDVFPLARKPAYAASARPSTNSLPSASLSDTGPGVTTVTAPAGATVQLVARGGPGVIEIAGVSTPLGRQWTGVIWDTAAGPGARQPFMTIRRSGPVEVRIATITSGWPRDDAPLPPRPRSVMPWAQSDRSVTLAAKMLR